MPRARASSQAHAHTFALLRRRGRVYYPPLNAHAPNLLLACISSKLGTAAAYQQVEA
jgi:hypothetical protein